MWYRRGGPKDEKLHAFLKRATIPNSGYYHLVTENDRLVEFVAYTHSVYVCVRDPSTAEKFHVDFLDLKALNEMQVIAELLNDKEGQVDGQ